MVENRLQYNNNEPVINRIKRDPFPLIIYGAGTMAIDVLDILNSNGIDISGVVVDDEYFSAGSFLKGIPVVRFSKIRSLYENYSIILGRADYTKAESLKGTPGLNSVYYLTSPIYKLSENISRDEITRYSEIYNETYDALEDDKSRDVFISWINSRINDDASMIFPYYSGSQDYFVNDIWSVADECSFLDIGAYTGDTVSRYFTLCGNGHAWAFEADKTNFETLRGMVEEMNISDSVELFNNALWSEHSFAFWGGPSEKNQETGFVDMNNGTDKVELYTVDELLQNRNRKVGLLKINFPGAEEVIKGAKGIILEDMPYLTVRVGFNKHEIATVPVWIKRNFPSYKIYMRYNMCIPAGLCLYATKE